MFSDFVTSAALQDQDITSDSIAKWKNLSRISYLTIVSMLEGLPADDPRYREAYEALQELSASVTKWVNRYDVPVAESGTD